MITIMAKEIFYYEKEGKYVLLHVCKINICSICISSRGSAKLPFNWQDTVEKCLAKDKSSADGYSFTNKGDVIYSDTMGISAQVFDRVCRQTAATILKLLDINSVIIKRISECHDDVAEIYLKGSDIQAAFISADIRDLVVNGVDLSRCESERIIFVKRNDLSPETDFDGIIEKISDTISEYTSIG